MATVVALFEDKAISLADSRDDVDRAPSRRTAVGVARLNRSYVIVPI